MGVTDWLERPPNQTWLSTQAIDFSTNASIAMQPAERFEDHDALGVNHDQTATAFSPNVEAPATAFPGLGTLQPDSTADVAADYTRAALAPPESQNAVMGDFEARNTSATNPKRRTTYLRSTCATCEAPLDTSELLLHLESPHLCCTRNNAPDHLPLDCLHTGCGLKFKDLDALRQHSEYSDHVSVQCGVPGCITSLRMSAVDNHYDVFHADLKYQCAECGRDFKSLNNLSSHGTDETHHTFICGYPSCDSTTTTHWDLHRHELKHRKNVPGYPCPRCPRYRGNNSFKRKDHLRQHMRNSHMVADAPRRGRRGPFGCKFHSCEFISPVAHPNTLAELAAHMLEEHQSMPYVCDEAGCLRIGMNGFETQKALIVHSKNDHVSAYQCKQLGCDRVGNNGWKRKADAIKHMKKKHGIVELYN